jgi:hypothetical protein
VTTKPARQDCGSAARELAAYLDIRRYVVRDHIASPPAAVVAPVAAETQSCWLLPSCHVINPQNPQLASLTNAGLAHDSTQGSMPKCAQRDAEKCSAHGSEACFCCCKVTTQW